MATMKGQAIIIKKVKKGGHGGHHGGSWKVAYADFVTAMMAFFLLLWLLSMVEPKKKIQLSAYFKNFTLFKSEQVSGTSTLVSISDVVQVQNKSEGGGEGKGEQQGSFVGEHQQSVMEEMKKNIETKLSDVKDQILIDYVEEGIRIQLIDKDGNPIFMSGSAELTPLARRALQVIADNILTMPNKIAIEGHTDSVNYAKSKYTNWELSTDRASSARRELERDGFDPDRINRVSGYASTEPLIKDNIKDPRNRRISIVVLKNEPLNPEITPPVVTPPEVKPEIKPQIKAPEPSKPAPKE